MLLLEQLILKKEPYQLINTKNGMEGMDKALEMQPDLALMDVLMPQMNGFDAVRWRRQRDATRALPIVMVTTQAEAEDMEVGYPSGCCDYNTKPIDSTDLLTKARKILGN